ncbi:MAG: SDR family oxidoreductase [Phycisphaeraceae bacterium]|nr:SDR family oxidoreductase [Phycisphaeraceae bacterium]
MSTAMPNGRTDHPVAIITGAGSGIGRAAAVALARAGCALVLVGRRREALSQTAALCASAGGVEVIGADVADEPQVRGVIARAVERFGRIDALINNAGYAEVEPVERTTPELLERTFRVNAFAAAWAIHHAWPVFQRQHAASNGTRRVCIVNVTSMASIDPFPGFFAYGASKAAANLLAASAAKDGSAIGVRAFAVAPGATETPMLRSAFDEKALPRDQVLDPSRVGEVIAGCVLGRHDEWNGRVIPVLSDAHRPGYAEFLRANPPIPAQ